MNPYLFPLFHSRALSFNPVELSRKKIKKMKKPPCLGHDQGGYFSHIKILLESPSNRRDK
jgi:hypothetical protein